MVGEGDGVDFLLLLFFSLSLDERLVATVVDSVGDFEDDETSVSPSMKSPTGSSDNDGKDENDKRSNSSMSFSLSTCKSCAKLIGVLSKDSTLLLLAKFALLPFA